jgi:prepilin-type processing-associated H-X9-DG protein/prepilin-type N-terminal cleavage/methylation domain-containing protein
MIRRNQNSRAAFSLVELLVVVSIITLLISISLPSLSGARQKAQRASCGTRLHALSIALQTYLAEFNYVVPINGLIMPKPYIPTIYQGVAPFNTAAAQYPDQWRLEFGALWPYMGGPPMPIGYSLATANTKPLPPTNENMAKLYLCPDDGLQRTYVGTSDQPLYMDLSDGKARVKQGVGSPGYWSYSVNSVLNSMGRFRNRWGVIGDLPWSDPLHFNSVKAPADFITFLEEDNASLMNDEVFDAPAYNAGDMLSGRHSHTANVAFGDGHVEVFSQTVFNNVVSAIDTEFVQHPEAMQSEITRMFFPDRGAFAIP